MSKITTNEDTIFRMALVGYELQRNRIEAAIAEIQAELGQVGSGRSNSAVSTTAVPKATRKKRFSAASRKRMAAAQKKRWNELRAKKAQTKKAKATATPKRKKASTAPTRKQQPILAKAAKKVVLKVKAKATSKPTPRVAGVRVKKAVPPSEVQKPVPEPQVAAQEPAAVVTQ